MDFEDLMFKAGDATSAPQGEIPRQKVPGWIRWPLRAFFLPFVLLDVIMQKFARILLPPPYVKGGKCKKRGNCCYYIMIRKPKGIWGWIFQFWNMQINGFYLRSKEDFEYEGHRVMVMGCRYLQKDGSCKHYQFRPMVCRKWPVIEQFGIPRILKGCGFTATLRNKK
ncbi:MAG: hypothetical protein KR126chlam3_00338 [Chlamydiae bacterium]|nr:hypothetical protein [Chlamydiota bacterium]